MIRTLRGAWSRRWTLLPLLLLTTVVVAGTVTVISFADAAGTSRLLAAPLLLLGLVAVPGTARELAAARRGEVALARLRGLEGGELSTLLTGEPLVVLGLGALAGLGLGALGGSAAASAWAEDSGSLGVAGVMAGVAVVAVGLVALLVGMAGALNEPLTQQVSIAARPRAASVLAVFGSVMVVVAAVVAAYRSSVAAEDPDWVVLAGPALVGLAVGEIVVWLLRASARVAVPVTAHRGVAAFLAVRRLARVADAVTAVRLLVAAAVVSALAVTGAEQVDEWSEHTARLRAGAPVQVVVDTDAPTALELTREIDPDGGYLMAAVLVPGTGAIPNRRAFLDTSRYDRVLGDFYADTPAADLARWADELGRDEGEERLAVGDTVRATLRGVSPREEGRIRPRVLLQYRDSNGRAGELELSAELGLAGAPVTVEGRLRGCSAGCSMATLTLSRTPGDARLPFVVTALAIGDLDGLSIDWVSTDVDRGAGAPGPLQVADGLMATAAPALQTAHPALTEAGPTPILATDTAVWADGPPELDSPGGDERPAVVLQRFRALPLVEADGVVADLARAAAGAPPTVPAAVVMVLARADTPAAMLASLGAVSSGPPSTLADVQDRTATATGAAQARVYLLMAACCLLVALLVLATATARQRSGWLRDLAALRVVGIEPRRLRAAGLWEVLALAAASVVGTAVGAVLAVRLLLAHLSLVTVPDHALPLRTALEAGPVVAASAACAVVVLVVAGPGRGVGSRQSRPAILREETDR